MAFSRQEDWTGLPFPTPEDLSKPGAESASPESPALAGGLFTMKSPGSLLAAAAGHLEALLAAAAGHLEVLLAAAASHLEALLLLVTWKPY